MLDLPPLPKKYDRKEAKIDDPVLEWFENNYPVSVAVEVKVKGNKTISHQDAALEKVQAGKFRHKLADTGRRQPFDGFVLKNAHAFVVTCDGRRCHAVRKDGKEEFDLEV